MCLVLIATWANKVNKQGSKQEKLLFMYLDSNLCTGKLFSNCVISFYLSSKLGFLLLNTQKKKSVNEILSTVLASTLEDIDLLWTEFNHGYHLRVVNCKYIQCMEYESSLNLVSAIKDQAIF